MKTLTFIFIPLHQACKMNLLLEICYLITKDNWQLVRPKLGEPDTLLCLQKPQKTMTLNGRMKNFNCCTLFINSRDFFLMLLCERPTQLTGQTTWVTYVHVGSWECNYKWNSYQEQSKHRRKIRGKNISTNHSIKTMLECF